MGILSYLKSFVNIAGILHIGRNINIVKIKDFKILLTIRDMKPILIPTYLVGN